MASPGSPAKSRYSSISGPAADRSAFGKGASGSAGHAPHERVSTPGAASSGRPRRVPINPSNLNDSQHTNPELLANYPRSMADSEMLRSTHAGFRQHPSSRRYPEFLSISETLYLQLSWAYSGLKDGLRLDRVVRILVVDAEVRAHMLKSFILNLLSLCSIYVFDLILLPLLHRRAAASSLTSTSGLYQFLWVLPVVGGSLYFNGIWSSTIAEKVYTLQHGRRHAASPTTYLGFISSIASSAYRVILIVTSITVSFALSYIPVVGKSLSFLFTCWIDSYYCFEFVWQAKGMALASRVKYLEERWAYFLAFGLPITAVCVSGNSLANTAIFALAFPAYIILAIYANPVPPHPYSPVPPITSATTGEQSYPFPSPFIPTRVPVFAIVIWINTWVIYAIDILTGGKKKTPVNPAELNKHRDVDEVVESGMPAIPLRDLNDRAQARHRVKTRME